jgi:segregation and condensation protein B
LNDATANAAQAPSDRAPPPLERIIEALLFAGGQPLTVQLATSIIRGLSADTFLEAVATLTKQYRQQGRPYGLVRRTDGHVLVLKPTFQHLHERITGGPREARLTATTLDVLAVVAYRQPLSRTEIDALRGHDSAASLRQLVRLGLVVVESVGGMYSTTPRFLDLFGLRSLDDLPRTQDLQKI